ncbi:MAG: B12-binding domain-containing radical SAM protein [Acutalibacteraceae bacterium]
MINPKVKKYYKSVTSPLGILAIATYLKTKGYNVKIIDACLRRFNYRDVIADYKPDVVGISLMSPKSITDAMKISEIARSCNLPVIWGGALASLIPKIILEENMGDYVVIGEGEVTFDELLCCLRKGTEPEEVKGLAYKSGGEVRVNNDRAFADLKDFPVLDWSLVNPSDYFQSMLMAEKMLYLYSGKGCPGRCTFCFNRDYNKCVYRKRPMEYCVEEIKRLVTVDGADGIHFADELWGRNKEEINDNCLKLRGSGVEFFWGCNLRIGICDSDDFRTMYEAGCRWIFFGVESGSEVMQRKIKKGIRLDRVEETIKSCSAAGIVPITSFIVGFPGETREDIKKTVDLAEKIPMAMYDFNFFFPLPGTEMAEELVEQGKLKYPKTLKAFSKFIQTEKLQFNFSNIPKKEIKVIRAYFMWSSLTKKVTLSGSKPKGNSFFNKAVKDAFKGLKGLGIKDSILLFIYDAWIFADILSSLLFYPGTRKKYGLTKRKQIRY